jgi:hypothetical protein
VRGAKQRANIERARGELAALVTALENYKRHYGDYPWLGTPGSIRLRHFYPPPLPPVPAPLACSRSCSTASPASLAQSLRVVRPRQRPQLPRRRQIHR